MKNLFLIDGASGTGKSDLIKYIRDFNDKTGFIVKYTTRKAREYEVSGNIELDLHHLTVDEFDKLELDYVYKYAGNKYGFSKNDIKEAFKNNNTVFLIIRSVNMMEKIKEDYKHYNVVTIFVYTDRDMIIERLKRDNHSNDDIKLRLERLGIAYKSYLDNPSFYDEIIINSGSMDDYRRICDVIIRKHESKNLVEENQIFVMMSFHPKQKDIFREFKLAAEKVNPNLIVKRLDEQRGDYQITDEILENIKKANLIICDLTDERPNVYYELGYARGLKKRIISCAKEGTVLHFDIRNFRTIFYNSLSELGDELVKEIHYYYSDNL